MSYTPHTQYDEGTTAATIRGTAAMWEDTADTLRPVSAAKPFPVNAVSTTLPSGAATEATLATRLSESDFDTKTGSLTEAAPASDTASSGLNGRLQRIAQRLTSLIALLPSALVSGRLDVNLGAAPAAITLGAGTADVGTVQMGAQAGNSVDGVTADITGTSNTSVIAAQGGSNRTYLTHIHVQNSHATVSTWVNIKDGTTTRYTIYAPATGGGASISLPKPLRGTANTAWQAACETSGANVRVSASGYTSTT